MAQEVFNCDDLRKQIFAFIPIRGTIIKLVNYYADSHTFILGKEMVIYKIQYHHNSNLIKKYLTILEPQVRRITSEYNIDLTKHPKQYWYICELLYRNSKTHNRGYTGHSFGEHHIIKAWATIKLIRF